MKWKKGDPLPKIHCYVCGKVVTIHAARGKHSLDFLEGGSRRFRFFCETCAYDLYERALANGYLEHGWTLAPKWFADACVTLRRREQREA